MQQAERSRERSRTRLFRLWSRVRRRNYTCRLPPSAGLGRPVVRNRLVPQTAAQASRRRIPRRLRLRARGSTGPLSRTRASLAIFVPMIDPPGSDRRMPDRRATPRWDRVRQRRAYSVYAYRTRDHGDSTAHAGIVSPYEMSFNTVDATVERPFLYSSHDHHWLRGCNNPPYNYWSATRVRAGPSRAPTQRGGSEARAYGRT